MKLRYLIMLLALTLTSFSVQAQEEKWLKDSLSVEEKAQDFTLPDAFGNEVTLYDELEKGPVVLSFYRGSWCPICNMQLHEYQKRLPEIEALGAQLITVSPETPTSAELNIVKNNLTFKALSDQGNAVAKQYGIVWQVPEADREAFSAWLKESSGQTLKDYNDSASYELPVPATFVIDTDGTVTYAFKDVDYKKRAEIDDILAALKAIH